MDKYKYTINVCYVIVYNLPSYMYYVYLLVRYITEQAVLRHRKES